ncbi:MAG: hypothetical protein ACRDYZ_08815, partial [Acidimicrobiales bacterium]
RGHCRDATVSRQPNHGWRGEKVAGRRDPLEHCMHQRIDPVPKALVHSVHSVQVAVEAAICRIVGNG